MADIAHEGSTEADGWVAEIQDAVLKGIGAQGAPGPNVLDLLYKTGALSQYVAVSEAGARSLNLQASGHDRILKDSLEHALRQACALLIRQAAEKGASAMLYAHGAAPEPSLERLIDFTVFAAGSSPANFDPGLPYVVMEDIIDQCTIEEAELIFTYLETRIQSLHKMHASFLKSPGKLAVLRICNQLLRRLSRPSSSELCGRITMFLTQLLPLLDRSGVNVQGAFNDSHSTPVEDVPEGALDSSGQPVDKEFYKTFWGLQKVFQYPYSIMEPSAWAAAVGSIKKVLTEFHKQPVGLSSSSSSAEQEAGSMAEEVQLTVKYLSSPKLLRLQLQDAALRRHFLVQALICLHACQNPVNKGSTAAQLKKDALRSKQVVEAEELEGQLYAELEGLPKYGRQFAAAIRSILKRENRWGAWKAEGCPTFEKRSTAALQPLQPLKLAPRKRKAPGGKVDTGVPAINKLRNFCQDNVSCLTGKGNKRFAPEFREFMQPVITEMDPEECVEDQYKTKKDPIYAWKALRLTVRESITGLAQTMEPLIRSRPVRGKGVDLEDIVHRLLPDAVPAGARKKAEQAPGQPPVTQSRATSQDAAPAAGAAADLTPTASSKQAGLADASKAVSDNGPAENKAAPVNAKVEPVDATSAPQQDLQPGQAVEPMQTDLAAPAAASGVTAASTAGHAAALGSKADPPPAETEAATQNLPLAPASDSTAAAEVSALNNSPDVQLVDSKQAALSKVSEADSSKKQGGDTMQLKAEHVNGNSAERSEQEQKHSRPAENGAVPEEEAGAPVRPLRPAAKRTRRG